ncbi:hypothetical protein DENSPDRAFT_401776 [Dentipellis sp. KUC8613]|nr:hypothetical protein DENSPDRAFT_401776 [Dentipellis sp. KUC8613]
MHYRLFTDSSVKWTANQEKSIISANPPFFSTHEPAPSLESQVRRVYLQFLYLPEILMPLRQLPDTLLLLIACNETSSVPSLHAALDNISLTNRWCSYKYQDQIRNMLSSRDATDDLESQMATFSSSHWSPEESEADVSGSSEGESLRNTWLEYMEKREVQIQILIHLLQLSLPKPCPKPTFRPLPGPPRKRRRVQAVGSSSDTEENTPEQLLEDRLESHMDRLALWQMALPTPEAGDQTPNQSGQKTDVAGINDWTQTFCNDVVQPLFAEKLPSMYKLLRTKLFRIPPWSEDEDEPEPEEKPQPQPRPAIKRSSSSTSRAPSRSRSRSLSLSLSQDAERQQQTTTTRKRFLQREISMSRVFKEKPRRKPGEPAVKSKLAKTMSMNDVSTKSGSGSQNGVVLVAGTPQKPKAKSAAPVVLVGATPTKPKVSSQPSQRVGLQRTKTMTSDWSDDEILAGQ